MGDAQPDHSPAEALGSAFLHVTGIGSRIAKREADEEQLDALDDKMLTDLDREFHERGEEAIPSRPDIGYDSRPCVHCGLVPADREGHVSRSAGFAHRGRTRPRR